jgi:hypothetical protein
MITTFDLCAPYAVTPPAHHSQAPAAWQPARTRVIYVRLAPYAHLELACTKATGPLVAVLVIPAQDSYVPSLQPIGDLPSVAARPWPRVSTASWTAAPGAAPRPRPAALIPEPATWALLMLGFGAVGAQLRRRRAAGKLHSAAPQSFRPQRPSKTSPTPAASLGVSRR